MRKRPVLLVTVSVLVIVTALALLNTYVVRDGASGDLLWNKDKAYLFIHTGSLGYRLSYLRYVGDLIAGYFGDVPAPTSENSSVLVLEIDQDRIQRFQANSLALDVFTPMDQDIYSASEGVVFKWSGTEFQRASDQEVQRFKENKKSAPDFTNVDGWSKRCCVFSRAEESTFNLEIADRTVSLEVKQGDDRASSVYVELTRDAKSAERIWYLDQRPRNVSEAEYEHLFPRP